MRNFKNTNKRTKKIGYDVLISLKNKNVLIDVAKLYYFSITIYLVF